MENIEVIKYQTNTKELDIRIDYEGETVWLTQAQMASLFDATKQNISLHINNILSEKRVEESSVVKFYLTTATDGKTYNIKHYSLELVTLVGSRIDIKKTTEFKEYVINIINEYKKANKKYEIVKFIDNSVENRVEIDVNVDPSEETVWLTQAQMAMLFSVSVDNISLHINNIFKEKELEKVSVTEESSVTAADGKKYKTNLYNLDMIISVGYRVKSKRGILFRKWAIAILKNYLIKGFVIDEKRATVTNDNFNNLVTKVNNIQTNQISLTNVVNNHDARLLKVEDKVYDKEYRIDKTYFNGEFYDSYTLIQSIFESANSEIIIIDNYIDRSMLDRLVVKKSNVVVNIFTNINTSKLIGIDINTFNKQYGGLNVLYTTKAHDRYIIIDQTKIYHVGYSIKDLGNKIFTISESDSKIIADLLKNI